MSTTSRSGAQAQELGPSTRGTGSDAGPLGQIRQGHGVPGAQDVAGILTLGNGSDDQSRVRIRRQIFQRVHDEIAVARDEGLAEGAREDADAAERGQRRGRRVPLGADDDRLDYRVGGRRDGVADHARLGTR